MRSGSPATRPPTATRSSATTSLEIHEASNVSLAVVGRARERPGSRAAKYRQLFDQELGLERDATAVLCVLDAPRPQTPGELKQRTERLHRFDDIGRSSGRSTR